MVIDQVLVGFKNTFFFSCPVLYVEQLKKCVDYNMTKWESQWPCRRTETVIGEHIYD
jgi:hypothetical protein